MAAGEEKLKLVFSAVDRTLAPLNAVTGRLRAMNAPIRKVQKSFKDLAKEAHLDKIGAGIAKAAGWARNLAIAAAGAGSGLLAFTVKTAESADSLAEFTRLVGINVEEFQQLRWAAKRAGIDGEVFSTAMKSLAKNVGDAKAGTGRLAGLLKKVAPTTLKQIQATKSTGEALEIVLSAMRKLPDVSKRNTLASKAFGNSQLALLATLSPDELEAFRKEASELGMVMSTETATAAERVMDNVDALKGSVVGLAARIAESLFPEIEQVTGEMLNWIKAHRALIVGRGREWVLKVAKAVEQLADWLLKAVPQFAAFVEHMGGLKGILVVLAAVKLASLVSGVMSLAAAFTALQLSAGWIAGAAAALGLMFFYRKEIADFFGITQPAKPEMPKSPVGSAPDTSKWRPQVDVTGTIGIGITADQRAKIMQSKTMNPGLQFEALSRGVALGAQ